MNLTRKIILSSFLLLLSCWGSRLYADSLKGWTFYQINHNFDKHFYGYIYFEHDNTEYHKFDEHYMRFALGYKYNKWLKTAVAWDWFQNPNGHYYRYVIDNIGTIKEGNLSVSLRERYTLFHMPQNNSVEHFLRSRLKAEYSIPSTRLKPYIAIELFTWDNWKKTRHYVGTTVKCTDWMEFEGYYMYYLYNGKPANHIIGLGLNFDL